MNESAASKIQTICRGGNNVLRGNDLIECGVLIVRYFGGIRLGTGGMVRAYTQAAKAVISVAPLEPYVTMRMFDFATDFANLQRIEYLVGQIGILSLTREFGASEVTCRITATQEQIDDFRAQAGRLIRCSA